MFFGCLGGKQRIRLDFPLGCRDIKVTHEIGNPHWPSTTSFFMGISVFSIRSSIKSDGNLRGYVSGTQVCLNISWSWLVVSKIVYVHPLFGEDEPNLTTIFQRGWFNPPTRWMPFPAPEKGVVTKLVISHPVGQEISTSCPGSWILLRMNSSM